MRVALAYTKVLTFYFEDENKKQSNQTIKISLLTLTAFGMEEYKFARNLCDLARNEGKRDIVGEFQGVI